MRRWGIVIGLGLVAFIFTVDANSVALALPVMGKTFRQTDEAMSWVILSYMIPLVLLMIPSGLVVTRWQPLATRSIGLVGFGIASILCALATSFSLLLAARAVQGSFAALLGTQGFALVGVAVKPHERGRAMGIVGAMAPLGAVMGPGLGGLLLTVWGWSAIFWINVPVILVALVLALLCLPGITFGPNRTSGLGQMWFLLRHGRFLGTLLILLISSAASGALAYLLPFTLQDVHHLSLAVAGVTLFVPSLGMALISPVGGYFTDRFGIRLILPSGWIVTLFGLLAILLAIATPTSALNLDWRLLLLGLGNGIAYGPLMTFMMNLSPRETLGSVSALSNLVRQFGLVCGPTCVSLLWSWQVGAGAAERASSSVWLLIALSIAGLICALLTIRGWLPVETRATDATEEMKVGAKEKIIKQA